MAKLIRIQFEVDAEHYPALHKRLSGEKNKQRRASLVKAFAERYLTSEQILQQNKEEFHHPVTFQATDGKLHNSGSLLSTTLLESNAMIGAEPPAAADRTETSPTPAPKTTAPARVGANDLVLLSSNVVESNTPSGADALTAVLGDKMIVVWR